MVSSVWNSEFVSCAAATIVGVVTYDTMEVETIVESRVGEIDKVTASDWHLVGVQLKKEKDSKKQKLSARMSDELIDGPNTFGE